MLACRRSTVLIRLQLLMLRFMSVFACMKAWLMQMMIMVTMATWRRESRVQCLIPSESLLAFVAQRGVVRMDCFFLCGAAHEYDLGFDVAC